MGSKKKLIFLKNDGVEIFLLLKLNSRRHSPGYTLGRVATFITYDLNEKKAESLAFLLCFLMSEKSITLTHWSRGLTRGKSRRNATEIKKKATSFFAGSKRRKCIALRGWFASSPSINQINPQARNVFTRYIFYATIFYFLSLFTPPFSRVSFFFLLVVISICWTTKKRRASLIVRLSLYPRMSEHEDEKTRL